jgi:hypothetical protein
VGDPIDAGQQLGLVAGDRRGALEVQHDLRLDPRLSQVADGKAAAGTIESGDGAIVDVGPDRRVNAVLRPDGPVSEADLAPDRSLAAGSATAQQFGANLVGGHRIEIRLTSGDRRDQDATVEGVEQLGGDGIGVHLKLGGGQLPTVA